MLQSKREVTKFVALVIIQRAHSIEITSIHKTLNRRCFNVACHNVCSTLFQRLDVESTLK